MKTSARATALGLSLLVAGVAAALPAAAQTATEATTADTMMKVDKASFIKAVASSNEFEIASSKLALEHASKDDVKKFAQMMIDDHTKAGKEFAAAAGQEAPSGEAALNPKHAAMLKELSAAGMDKFDQLYIDAQTAAHMEAVSLFRSYSSAPDDEALGAFAKKTLPTLEMHLEHVKALASAK